MWRGRRRSPVDKFRDAGGGTGEAAERHATDRRRVMFAEQVRRANELVRRTQKGLARARRSRDLKQIQSWERSHELARSMLDRHLARFPELADRELVGRLAPTRWERLVRQVLRSSR